MESVPRKIRTVYATIERARKKYGVLKKCEFHIHTPASPDYTLYEKYNAVEYKELTDIDIINFAVDEGLLSHEAANVLISEIDYYHSQNYFDSLKSNGKPYESLKDYLVYMLIIHRLIKEEIEVAIISDHNTTKGYPKLRSALLEYYKERESQVEKPLHLLLGVEISCSELNHVIAIFDHNEINVLNKYLEEILINEDGTYLSSCQVIDDIVERGGFAYIAHVDTSYLHGSLVYNQRLFTSKSHCVLGFRNIQESHRLLRDKINHYCNHASKKFCCIAEGDSHSLDNIGQRCVWIKFGKVNFSSLKKAFKDHHICVYSHKPQRSDKFIKGIVVEPGSYGFLRVNPNKIPDMSEKDRYDFVASFSRDLNCIIGGRGTGKSTILNAIETSLTLQIDDRDKLEFISKHNSIYIVFYCEGYDYVLQFIPQIKRLFDKDEEVVFLPRAFDGDDLANHWIELYRIARGAIMKVEYPEASEILHRKLYRRGYSINNLVFQINEGTIGQFIKNTVMYGEDYYRLQSFYDDISGLKIYGNYKSHLKKNLGLIWQTYQSQKAEVAEKLSSYNGAYQDKIQIQYSPRIQSVDEYLGELLKGIRKNDDTSNYVAKTLMTWDDVEYFIRAASESMGFIPLLDYLFNGRYEKIEEHIALEDCIDNERITSYKQVDIGLTPLTDKNKKLVYKAISDRIINFRWELIQSIKNWFELADDFSINFNINHKETVNPVTPLFKKITDLSLGQKVVAILTFVFTYGEHIGDNTPLIIDQPEDNLDNQYIFKNLVEALRLIKNKRQVIVVTHSSTIVTNADAEQVLVMESDNSNGWILASGYPSEASIVKHIINYLEGGLPSFKNKAETYGLIVSELTN